MAAALAPSEGRGHSGLFLPSSVPVVPADSDTPYASSDSLPQDRAPSPPPPSQEEQQETDHPQSTAQAQAVLSFQPRISSLPSPRNGRSQSLAATKSNPAAFANRPIKRKPLSATASPLAIQYSSGDHLMIASDLPKPETRFSRSFSVDSPTLYEFPERAAAVESLNALVRLSVDTTVSESSSVSQASPQLATQVVVQPAVDVEALESRNISDANPAALQTAGTDALTPHEEPDSHVTLPATHYDQIDYTDDDKSLGTLNSNTNTNGIMSLFVRKATPPHLSLNQVDTNVRTTANYDSLEANSPVLNKPLPKSPPKSPGSSKLGTFFGWGTSPSVSEFSDRPYSPLPSPFSPKPSTDASSFTLQGPISGKSDASEETALGYLEAYLPTPPAATPSHPGQLDEMEDELKAISAELAASIRREMDLEDLVDRLQAEVNNPQAPGKRTSDYFSDSGYSSAKFSEYDQSKEEIAQIQRRSEQEKAQIRLDLTNKLQDERSKRKVLDQQIKELGEKASQIDTAQLRGRDADARVRELEKTCEDLRRRLSEERQVKDNFEDLLSALKGELQNAANERDNLRDEIVPQLKARVEGLESQAAENEKLTYETTKMQQELQSLKMQNTTMNAARSSEDTLTRLRSSSVTGQSFKLQHPPTGLSRSNTVKNGQTESREALSERLKDVEAQRDALHNALKNLLERQEFQNRENEKKIKVLEVERDRLLSSSPKKAGYERDVSNLREEINVLRRRAEEAIEQKWLVEKGLIGLKSDLDRAEEEIASLRALLKEKDILIPDSFARSSSQSNPEFLAVPVTSASLEKAYKELQESYREALERIKNLEVGGTSASQDERTKLAMERLEQSLSTAIHERDDARQEAAAYRDQLETLQQSEASHLASERDLADQLRESARRVEELAQQVRNQLSANATLRTRLSDAVARGESDQRMSKDRLAKMQDRMRALEEQVVAVQTAAEERVTRHEDELRDLKDAHSTQLQRLRDASGGLRSPRLFPPKSPLSPLLSPNSAKRLSPRPSPRRSTTMPVGQSDKEELAQVETLKARVLELERALSAADSEMQEVVGRMNTAQIEVLALQEERENAVRETRRLQRLLEQEKVKSFEERFNSISTMVK